MDRQATVQAQATISNPTERGTWIVIFTLVMLQMSTALRPLVSTALRPLVGTADTFLPEKKKFFLSHWADCVDRPASQRRWGND